MNFPIIEPGNAYTHTGGYFAKMQLMHHSHVQKQQDILLLVSEKKQKLIYFHIAKACNIGLKNIHTLQAIEDLCGEKNTPQIACVCEEDLGIQILERYKHTCFRIEKGAKDSREKYILKLNELGYIYSDYNTPGSYRQVGDTLYITKENGQSFMIVFFGDEIEDIICNSIALDGVELYQIHALDIQEEVNKGKKIALKEILKNHKELFVIGDTLCQESREYYRQEFQLFSSFDILEQYNSSIITQKLPYSFPDIQDIESLKSYIEKKERCIVYTQHEQMLGDFIKLNSLKNTLCLPYHYHIYESFCFGETAFIADDILGKVFVKKRNTKRLSQDVDLLLKIHIDDYVVHREHGVGVYKGLTKKSLAGAQGKDIIKEYLCLEYANSDMLYVPIQELSRVSKYVGVDNPKITPLSGKQWSKKMKKAQEDIEKVAQELLESYAKRALRNSTRLHYREEDFQKFLNSFPYEYTKDQEICIQDIRQDLMSENHMDRLVVGDVGFGKTEIAFAAAYANILSGRQVAFISPLVVLAHEHFQKAKERFAEFGVRVAILTRLQSQKEMRMCLEALKTGEIDIVIGTHRLLSSDIEYKTLGLLIIDEEHKFGVQDKEKIKKLKSDIDLLALSATPIPRSLNMALSGLRDISLLKIPPKGRKSIETYVAKYHTQLIQNAGKREFERGGQLFFIHNRVQTLQIYKQELEKIFPKKRIIEVHGQLPGDELEDRIIAFKEKKYDILLATTVIENGIDFSNVNTIFINNCQEFGISQIHQLRGRVGRSDAQAYCYLLYKKEKLDTQAEKRLQTIVDYSYLGSGFELAMKDLEVRGSGDILGIRQSGNGNEIGISLFLQLLEQTIEKLKNKKENSIPKTKTSIDIAMQNYIEDDFFTTQEDKIQFYREIEAIESKEDLEYLENLLENPENQGHYEALLHIYLSTKLSVLAKDYHISSIKKAGAYYIIHFSPGVKLDTIKQFLERDTKLYFQLIDMEKLRCSIKVFTSEKLCIQYLIDILDKK